MTCMTPSAPSSSPTSQFHFQVYNLPAKQGISTTDGNQGLPSCGLIHVTYDNIATYLIHMGDDLNIS